MPNVQLIQKLRELTGAGMMACKKALDDTNENFDKAVELLRKSGAVKAAKVADRSTNEGVVRLAINKEGTKGSIVEVDCETDFVAKNQDFITVVDEIAKFGLTGDSKERFEQIKDDLILKIGENIKLAETGKIEGQHVYGYIHGNNKRASLVAFSGDIDRELGKDIAMHITAMSPKYISKDEIPAEILLKEREIYTELVKKEGKPDNIIEKIVEGKMNKFYEEVCLLNQSFIKDDEKKIQDIIGNAKIEKFALYSLCGSNVSCN